MPRFAIPIFDIMNGVFLIFIIYQVMLIERIQQYMFWTISFVSTQLLDLGLEILQRIKLQ